MMELNRRSALALRRLLFLLIFVGLAAPFFARPHSTPTKAPPTAAPPSAKKTNLQNDSVFVTPAKDLLLRIDGEHKADALAHFVEGLSFEENGEMDKALAAYRKVLDLDPGQAELASRVAALLARQDEYPQAIDVLKDAIKANPKATEPLLQLAFIYTKYLNRTDQALELVNRAIAIDPQNIDAYERICEIAAATGDEKKALQVLNHAAELPSGKAEFWMRLGKLYASIVFKPDKSPEPEDIARVNQIFKKAAERAGDDANVLKETADYFASTQQIKEAIPLYLKLLDLAPEDTNAREKLAAGFLLTNQRDKAVEMLDQIIKEHPEKYQPYDLLAGLLDDTARALEREKKNQQAKPIFAKAAANYEQSLVINPARVSPYLHLAELLLGPLKEPERAVKVLGEARQRFRQAPEIAYYLAIAQREAKHSQESVATFEEALREAEAEGAEIANARFYFDYGAAAEQAGLYDKAADLFRKSIAVDPANAAEAYNYLAYMWAQHNTHLDEAEQMIKLALQADAKNGAYLDTLGWLEFREGKFEQALSDLQRAAQNLTRDDPVVLEHIGDVCAKLNKSAQAIDAWQKALMLDPKNKTLADKIDNAKTRMSKGESPNTNSFQ
ncbi:MAG TPA: tetratricopeptide repeat protein [Chthoniobacterales bacterium]|nr:tetratricopeptide repeat protein [Chthoniobacterales bacterium]